jgi:hypothetical protein
MRPSLWSESAESEHSFIEIHYLSVRLTHLMQEWFHSMEVTAIIRFSKDYFSLASLDIFEPDFVLQINATDGWWRYFLFHQIVDETVALSQLVIDERILATWTERPSTQCVAISTFDQFVGPISKE